jgi:hypothetical protein
VVVVKAFKVVEDATFMRMKMASRSTLSTEEDETQ